MSNQTICDQDTPDPWMVAHAGHFYLTFTAGDRVEIWTSKNMENFRSCAKSVVWKPGGPPDNPWFRDLWAPEIHYLGGTWYVYFTGAKPVDGQYNSNRRTLLLRCKSQDPMETGAWEFLGQVAGLPDHWNIDATVFYLHSTEKLYCCYSGWPLGDFSDKQQDLFLVEMISPEAARPDSLLCISRADLPWERADQGTHGVNEGPTFVSIPGFQGIVYSANGSWTSDYRLGVLHLVDPANPLREGAWVKRNTPLLVSDKQHGGPFGPGHASFIPSPYGDGRVFCIYHATEQEHQGWHNRKARVLRFDAGHFHPQAQTMCCALSLTGQWSGGVSASSSGPFVGQGAMQANSPHHQHQAQAKRMSLVDKIGGMVMRKLREFG
jgi:GH43 family beta-xylosidase